MHFDGSNYDHNVLESMGDLPDGRYVCMLTDVERKSSKTDDTIWMFACEWEVIEGPLKGRKIFQNFMQVHPNPEAVRIGMGSFTRLFVVLTGTTGGMLQDLLNKPHEIELKSKMNKRTGESTQNISAIDPRKAAASAPPPMQQQRSPLQPPQQPQVPPSQMTPAQQTAHYGANTGDFAPNV